MDAKKRRETARELLASTTATFDQYMAACRQFTDTMDAKHLHKLGLAIQNQANTARMSHNEIREEIALLAALGLVAATVSLAQEHA